MDKTLVEEIRELEAKIAGDDGDALTAKITDLEERLVKYKEAGQNSMCDDNVTAEFDEFDELEDDDELIDFMGDDDDDDEDDDEFIALDDNDDGDEMMSYMQNIDDKMSMMMRYMRRGSRHSNKGSKEARETITEEEISSDDSDEYQSRMVEASSRLDRVATYLEESGHDKLAFKIDTLTDAIDENRKILSN